MHEVEIILFGKNNCRCIVFENPGNSHITIPFQGRTYDNVTVYRPLKEVIPTSLHPQVHQCVKNAFYVSTFFHYDVVEGVILVLSNEGYNVEPHCWNICDGRYLDVTPFERDPLDIMYFPFRTYKREIYSDKFGEDTSLYTFLSGNQILQFNNKIREIMQANSKQ